MTPTRYKGLCFFKAGCGRPVRHRGVSGRLTGHEGVGGRVERLWRGRDPNVPLLLAAALALSLLGGAAEAQAPRTMPTVGWVSVGGGERAPQLTAFKAALRELGWIEGRTVRFEPRWAHRQRNRVPSLFRDLIDHDVDVIVSQGGAISGALDLPGETPIVFGYSGDPVIAGVVDSFARPGGRFTGVSFMSFELNEKRLELIREVLPATSRAGLLGNPRHPGEQRELEANRRAAKQLGLRLHYAPVVTAADLETAFDSLRQAHVQAIIVLQDGFFATRLARVINFALPARIPVVSGWAEFVESGVMMTYGPNRSASYRRAAYYVHRILQGAKPSELPVERPTRFELVISLKTAKALGITIPASVLLRADTVIE